MLIGRNLNFIANVISNNIISGLRFGLLIENVETVMDV